MSGTELLVIELSAPLRNREAVPRKTDQESRRLTTEPLRPPENKASELPGLDPNQDKENQHLSDLVLSFPQLAQEIALSSYNLTA